MLRILASSPQIVSASSLSKIVLLELRKCPSDTYVIVSQPGVNVADYHDRFSAPHMRRNIAGDNKNVRSSMTVSNVLGTLDAGNISKEVQEKCGADVLHLDASSKWSSGQLAVLGTEYKQLLILISFSSWLF